MHTAPPPRERRKKTSNQVAIDRMEAALTDLRWLQRQTTGERHAFAASAALRVAQVLTYLQTGR